MASILRELKRLYMELHAADCSDDKYFLRMEISKLEQEVARRKATA